MSKQKQIEGGASRAFVLCSMSLLEKCYTSAEQPVHDRRSVLWAAGIDYSHVAVHLFSV